MAEKVRFRLNLKGSEDQADTVALAVDVETTGWRREASMKLGARLENSNLVHRCGQKKLEINHQRSWEADLNTP